jgi:hypothetical protein
MFVVFDVTVDGQTADVSKMSFSLVSTFLNEKVVKAVTETSDSRLFFR